MNWPRSRRGIATASPAIRGALWMIAGAAALTVMAALIRVISSELPLGTIVMFRSAFSLFMLIGWMLMTGRMNCTRTRYLWSHLARATCGAISIALLIVAYRRLDFALATALAYTTPLWVIVVSILFLGERPGWRRSLATVIGFIGIIVIVRPLPLLDPGIWAALASAAFGACALAYVRRLSGLEPTETLLFYFFLFAAVLSAIPAVAAAVMPSIGEFGLLAALSAAGTLGLACAAQAYRLADATIVAPLDFLRLPMAGLVGFAFFGEVPQWWLLAGASIMIASLYFIVATGRPRFRRRGSEVRQEQVTSS